jgi:hypothetical protein
MKKALAYILCILLISGAATLRFGSSVKKTADKVEFTEEVLLGDPKEAEGLHGSFARERANPYRPSEIGRYTWTTEACFRGGSFEAETLHQYGYENRTAEVPESVQVRDMPFLSGSVRFRNDTVEALRKKYSEEMDRGASVMETVPAPAFYDRHPLQISILQKATNGIFHVYNSAALGDRLYEYFNFDIERDWDLSVTIGPKDVRATFLGGDWDPLLRGSGSLSYGGSLYFYFDLYSSGMVRKDYSKVPGGYGIYKVDFSYEGGVFSADPGSLTTFRSFGDDVTIEFLKGSANGKYVYAFIKTAGEYAVCILDEATGEEIQRLKICERSGGMESFVWQEGSSLIFGAARRNSEQLESRLYVLEEDEKGLLSPVLDADLSLLGDTNTAEDLLYYADWKDYSPNGTVPKPPVETALYEDGKLYIAVPDLRGPGGDYEIGRCGIAVVVFGKEGPLFLGNYKSSLGGNTGIIPIDRNRSPQKIWIEK